VLLRGRQAAVALILVMFRVMMPVSFYGGVLMKYDREKLDRELAAEIRANVERVRNGPVLDTDSEDVRSLQDLTVEMPWDKHGRWRSMRTNEERLDYYRSHGLVHCADYPGGDAAFEADVLSGEFHEFGTKMRGELLREDAYIVQCLNEDRFCPGVTFSGYGGHRAVRQAARENMSRRGFTFGSV